MAAKVFFLLALVAVVVSADDCDCDPPNEIENKALWNFLTKLSADINIDDPEDKEMRAILPGVLSPLLECNCLEKNRRKRKVTPEVQEDTKNEISEEFRRQKKSINYHTKRCPHGHVWIGIKCAPVEFIDK